MRDRLKVRLLTGDDLRFDDGHSQLPALRPRALFILLALDAGKALSRDRLCDLLWPYTDQSAARQRLRMALMKMKQGLADDLRARLLTTADSICLLLEPDEVDALDFAILCREGSPAAREAALSLYTGDLLGQMPSVSDNFDRLVAGRRDDLRSLLVSLLHAEMTAELQAGNRSAFGTALSRALEADPTNEDTVTLAMTSAAAAGQAARVREIFEAYTRAVEEELGAHPPEEMAAVSEALFAEAKRKSSGMLAVSPTGHAGERLNELRAKPRVDLRAVRGRRSIIAMTGVAFALGLAFAAGLFELSDRDQPVSARQVFLLRGNTPLPSGCGSETESRAIEAALLRALESLEGSETLVGTSGPDLFSNGIPVHDVDLALACEGSMLRATVTLSDARSRGILWIGRYTAGDLAVSDPGVRILSDIVAALQN